MAFNIINKNINFTCVPMLTNDTNNLIGYMCKSKNIENFEKVKQAPKVKKISEMDTILNEIGTQLKSLRLHKEDIMKDYLYRKDEINKKLDNLNTERWELEDSISERDLLINSKENLIGDYEFKLKNDTSISDEQKNLNYLEIDKLEQEIQDLKKGNELDNKLEKLSNEEYELSNQLHDIEEPPEYIEVQTQIEKLLLLSGAFKFKKWDANKTYKQDDIILFDGLYYILTKAKPNNLCTDIWDPMPRLVEIYLWDYDEIYNRGDLVVFQNKIYIRKYDMDTPSDFQPNKDNKWLLTELNISLADNSTTKSGQIVSQIDDDQIDDSQLDADQPPRNMKVSSRNIKAPARNIKPPTPARNIKPPAPARNIKPPTPNSRSTSPKNIRRVVKKK